MTGARRCVDSCCVTSGMFAPPPTVATAETFANGILLCCNVSWMALSTPSSDSAISCSSSVRVTRTSEVNPGRSAWMTAAVSADSCSLATRASLRSRASELTAAVPAGSASLAAAMPAMTWLSSSWSIWSPENSG
nr:hypothetical protein CPGR_00539 [Mycolicibacterium malmesburyense]